MRKVFSVLGVVALAAGAVLGETGLPSPLASAKPDGVPGFFITNDPSHPVPVVEQNLDPTTGNAIRVHEQGTVDVNVTNGTLPVQVAERRLPLQQTSYFDDWGTEQFRTFHIDVPDGKILVVETIGVSAVVESGQKVRASVTFQSAGLGNDEFEVGEHMLTLERVDGFGPGDVYTTMRSITGYGAGHGGVLISVARNATTGTGGRVQFSISGYLIDIPAE